MNNNEVITGYKVVRENSKEKFEESVNEIIRNKYYQPFGGVSIAFGEGGAVIYAQAFVTTGAN